MRKVKPGLDTEQQELLDLTNKTCSPLHFQISAKIDQMALFCYSQRPTECTH